MGEAPGFVLRAEVEPTVNWAGDMVQCGAVAEVFRHEKPDVVVVHADGTIGGEGTLIGMDAERTIHACSSVGKVIATHLEAYDHDTVTRASLRAQAQTEGIFTEQLLIPEDGQIEGAVLKSLFASIPILEPELSTRPPAPFSESHRRLVIGLDFFAEYATEVCCGRSHVEMDPSWLRMRAWEFKRRKSPDPPDGNQGHQDRNA